MFKVDSVRSIRQVQGHQGGSVRSFLITEPSGYVVDEMVQRCGSRVVGTEAMLMGLETEGVGQVRKEEALQYLHGRTEKRDRAVAGGERRIFPWFVLGKSDAQLPGGRDSAGSEGKVEDGSKMADTCRSKMFEVEDGDTIGTMCRGGCCLLDCIAGLKRRKRQ